MHQQLSNSAAWIIWAAVIFAAGIAAGMWLALAVLEHTHRLAREQRAVAQTLWTPLGENAAAQYEHIGKRSQAELETIAGGTDAEDR
jgi:hypothetical protein